MPDKKKKYPIINGLLKTLIVILFVYVIYRQVAGKSYLDEMQMVFNQAISSHKIYYLLIAILLMPLNFWLEALKWKVLVEQFEKYSTLKAVESVLAGLAASLITPVRIGDYAGRAMKVKPENNWKAVWSNLINSIAMNIVTFSIGVAGTIILLNQTFNFDSGTLLLFSVAGSCIFIFFIIIYYNNELLVKIANKLKFGRLSKNLFSSLKVIHIFSPQILNKVVGISFLKYMVFVIQYLLLIYFWGIEGSVMLLLAAIAMVFMVQTSIPLPPILGLLARGEISLLILGVFTNNGLLILSATFGLWIINLGIPSLFGLYIILNTNITKSFGYE